MTQHFISWFIRDFIIYMQFLSLTNPNIKTSSDYKLMRNVAFFIMLGFLLYHLFPFPPILWRIGLVILSCVGLFIHIRHFRFSVLEKNMLVFIILNVLYFFTSFLWQTPLFTNFGNILCSLLPMYLFFVLAAHGAITQRSLTIFVIISTIAGYFYFIHGEQVAIQEAIFGESGELTVNASTIFLVILPLLFFIRNKWIVIGVSAIIIYFIIFGAKRGNIISAVVPFYLLIRMNMKKNKSLKNEIFLVLIVLALSSFAYSLALNNDYLLGRVDRTLEGDSSGRDRIYTLAFNTWFNSEHFYNILFGYGTDATVRFVGARAHNDWMEVLVNFGLVGVICYLSFFIALIKTVWRIKHNQQLFYALIAVFFIWFSKTIYSMGYTNNIFFYLSMTIGIVLGLEYRQLFKNEAK